MVVMMRDDDGGDDGSDASLVKLVLGKMDINVLRWFDHVENMEYEIIVKRVFGEKVDGVDGSRARGIPKMRWMDSLKASLERKGINVEEQEGA
jgi:hypothetical protein